MPLHALDNLSNLTNPSSARAAIGAVSGDGAGITDSEAFRANLDAVPTVFADPAGSRNRLGQSAAFSGPRLRVAFLGDSITNAGSGHLITSYAVDTPHTTSRSIQGWVAAMLNGGMDFVRNDKAALSVDQRDLEFGIDGVTALNYRNSTTIINSSSAGGSLYPTYAVTPVDHALAANPDVIVVLIGTNDIPANSAASVASRIENIAAYLAKTGKPVILGTLLPREGNTSSPTVETNQARINAVNALLPAIAERYGVTLVEWHTTLLSGGVANTAFYYDSPAVHPNAGGCARLAEELMPALAGFATAFNFPAADSPQWLTSNAYMTVDANSNGIADGFTPSFFVTPTHSIFTSDGESWQQMVEADSGVLDHRLFAPLPGQAALDRLAADQIPVRLVCEYEIVSGNVGALGMLADIRNAGNTTIRRAPAQRATVYDGLIPPHRGVLMTEPFLIPASPHNANSSYYFQIYGGEFTVRVRRFGLIEAF
jgi:lysophospholipase L1-like esterase